jgi:hypothetical protein
MPTHRNQEVSAPTNLMYTQAGLVWVPVPNWECLCARRMKNLADTIETNDRRRPLDFRIGVMVSAG